MGRLLKLIIFIALVVIVMRMLRRSRRSAPVNDERSEELRRRKERAIDSEK